MSSIGDYYATREDAWIVFAKKYNFTFESRMIAQHAFYSAYDIAYKLGCQIGDRARVDIIQNALQGIEPERLQ